MSIDQLIDGINRGGFTFIGILVVAGGIVGLIWVIRVGWPDAMKRIDRGQDQLDRGLSSIAELCKGLAAALQADADKKHAEIMAKLESLGRGA